jgi:hypothetical protein
MHVQSSSDMGVRLGRRPESPLLIRNRTNAFLRECFLFFFRELTEQMSRLLKNTKF